MALIFRTRKRNEIFLKVSMIIWCVSLVCITAMNCVDRLLAHDWRGVIHNVLAGLLFLGFGGACSVLNALYIQAYYRPANTASPEEIEAGRVMLFGKRKPRD
jgi:hypothetical protein